MTRIGIDFDNTIVNYDGVFEIAAKEHGLIDADVTATKLEIRQHLRQTNREDEWTKLQGHVYGPAMQYAKLFDGVVDFFKFCNASDIDFFIVSHRTRHPYLGPKHDLHKAAYDWLGGNEIFNRETGLTPDRVFYETSKEKKADRIRALACSHFIDDLPEFLDDESFPNGVMQLLFDPNNVHTEEKRFQRHSTWYKIKSVFKDPNGQSESRQ